LRGKSKSGEKTHGIEEALFHKLIFLLLFFAISVLNVAAIPICCGNKVAPAVARAMNSIDTI
jgi:hypothetical protein